MVGGGEVINQLRFMGGGHLFHGLDFHNDLAIHKDVGIKNADIEPVIGHFDWYFTFHRQFCLLQFMHERVAVNGLEEAMAESAMDFHGAPDNQMG